MRNHLIQILVSLTCCLFAGAASADERCAQPEQAWLCFGTVEMVIDVQLPSSAPSRTATLTIRYSSFTNDESLVEIEAGDEYRALMWVEPADLELYSGLTDTERSSLQKNPFLFFDIPLAGALQPLLAAYPAGPATVPSNETQSTVTVDSRTITFVARQIDASHVSYRVADVAQPYTVRWSAPRLAPRPDSQSLAGWSGTGDVHFATLGEARTSRAPR